VSKKVDGPYQSGPCRVWIKVRNPANIAVSRSAARFGTDERPRIEIRESQPSGKAYSFLDKSEYSGFSQGLSYCRNVHPASQNADGLSSLQNLT
jgi:hypothetical protein